MGRLMVYGVWLQREVREGAAVRCVAPACSVRLSPPPPLSASSHSADPTHPPPHSDPPHPGHLRLIRLRLW